MPRYKVPPSPPATEPYIVTTNKAGIGTKCTCPSFTFRKPGKTCKHCEAVTADPTLFERMEDDAPMQTSAVPPVLGPRPLPMLAHTLHSGDVLIPGRHIIETKWDGQRILGRVQGDLSDWWSRTGKDNNHKVNARIRELVKRLPDGLYDGELILPKGRSYNVQELLNRPDLTFMIFDVLESGKMPVTHLPLSKRKEIINSAMAHYGAQFTESELTTSARYIQSATWTDYVDDDQLWAHIQQLWDTGYEGVIIKDLHAAYEPNKRRHAFLKVKNEESAVLTVIGYVPGETTKQNKGDYATAVIADNEDNITAVKAKDDATRAKLERTATVPRDQWKWMDLKFGSKKVRMHTSHPTVGRLLRIGYHERTPDNSYRHPKWDRWEDE